MNCFNALRMEISGASHAPEISVKLSGLPEGQAVDLTALQAFVDRRKSTGFFATQRKEPDLVEIRSGVENGVTNGQPLVGAIKNTDYRPEDYKEALTVPRPSHADYAAFVKNGAIESGGGRFSGRMTAPLCIAGGIAVQLLQSKGIFIGAYVSEIGGIVSDSYLKKLPTVSEIKKRRQSKFMTGETNEAKIERALNDAKQNGDSLGGVVECIVMGMPAGVGDALFDGLESKISAVIYGIPAVKGVEFGEGFNIARLSGSTANDEFYIDNDRIRTYTNRSGGINGGITNGMPVTLRVAFRPTPSIAVAQRSVDLINRCNTTLTVSGRHDVCIVPRAAVVVEAAVALALLDELLL